MKRRRTIKHHMKSPRVILVIILSFLLVAWLIWSGLFAPPTKRQYEAASQEVTSAKDRLNGVERASSEYVQAIVASLRLTPDGERLHTDTVDARTRYDEAMKQYQAASRRLEVSAVKKDEDVQTVLERLSDTSAKLERMLAGLTDDYDEVYRAYVDCDQTVRASAAATDEQSYLKLSDRCQSALAALKKADTEPLKDYARELSGLISKKCALYAKDQADGEDMKTVDGLIMRTDPLTRVQQVKQEIFDQTVLDDLATLLERKRQAA